jgi:hypothetical protein
MLTLVAVLLGVAVVSAALAPREASFDRPSTVAPAPTATPSPAPEPRLAPRPAPAGMVTTIDDIPGEPPLHQLDAQGMGQDVEVEAGQRVRLAIASDQITTIQIGEDGPIEAVDPAAPARFDLSYERRMVLPIRDLTSDRTIGELRVVDAAPVG